MSTPMKRWRGLKSLVFDAVEHGSSAVERVHLGTAKRTFDVLEAIPGIDAPAKVVHTIHDLSVRSVYSTIRIVNRVVGHGLDLAFDVAGDDDGARSDPPGEPPSS
jgi:hypothetical protein